MLSEAEKRRVREELDAWRRSGGVELTWNFQIAKAIVVAHVA